MSHLVSYKCFRLNQYIPELGLLYKNVAILLGWRVSEPASEFEINPKYEILHPFTKLVK